MSIGPIASLMHFSRLRRRTLMESARLALELDPQIQKILADWDRMKPSLQNSVDLDTLCRAHGVEPPHFIALAGESALHFTGDASILIAAIILPNVVKASVKRALTTDGVADRRFLLEHAGFIPVPQRSVRMVPSERSSNPSSSAESKLKQANETLQNNE